MNILIRGPKVLVVRVDDNLIHRNVAKYFIMPETTMHMREGVRITTIRW